MHVPTTTQLAIIFIIESTLEEDRRGRPHDSHSHRWSRMGKMRIQGFTKSGGVDDKNAHQVSDRDMRIERDPMMWYDNSWNLSGVLWWPAGRSNGKRKVSVLHVASSVLSWPSPIEWSLRPTTNSSLSVSSSSSSFLPSSIFLMSHFSCSLSSSVPMCV